MVNINDYKPGKMLYEQDVTIRLCDLTPRIYERAISFIEREDDHNTLSDALVAINSLRSQIQLLGEKPIL